MSCDTSKLIYVVMCRTWKKQHMGEISIEELRLRGKVRKHQQHIYELHCKKPKVENNLQTCGKGYFS